jgi:hypothetical protein
MWFSFLTKCLATFPVVITVKAPSRQRLDFGQITLLWILHSFRDRSVR